MGRQKKVANVDVTEVRAKLLEMHEQLLEKGNGHPFKL